MKVLIAEHEPMWREFLCSALQSRGLEPIPVVNGERALSILGQRDAPRFAIIDRRLPLLDGVEICKQLRARRDAFYTYLLLLMPNTYRVEELVALESGADDCLPKPFGHEELSVRVAIGQRILAIDSRLTELNGRWRTLLDTLPFGVASVDQSGILKRMNRTFAGQMGYENSQELLGQPLGQVLRKRIDVDALLEQVRWAEPFNNVEVQCRGTKARSHSVRLWGRPLPPNEEAVYEIVVLESM